MAWGLVLFLCIPYFPWEYWIRNTRCCIRNTRILYTRECSGYIRVFQILCKCSGYQRVFRIHVSVPGTLRVFRVPTSALDKCECSRYFASVPDASECSWCMRVLKILCECSGYQRVFWIPASILDTSFFQLCSRRCLKNYRRQYSTLQYCKIFY